MTLLDEHLCAQKWIIAKFYPTENSNKEVTGNSFIMLVKRLLPLLRFSFLFDVYLMNKIDI